MPETILPRKALQYRPLVKMGIRNPLASLERPVHVVAEWELITQNCEWKKNNNNEFYRPLKALTCQPTAGIAFTCPNSES